MIDAVRRLWALARDSMGSGESGPSGRHRPENLRAPLTVERLVRRLSQDARHADQPPAARPVDLRRWLIAVPESPEPLWRPYAPVRDDAPAQVWQWILRAVPPQWSRAVAA